ncbi:MAG: C4-dicarboxylate ABC transporter substrate-binding protein, partial [Synergistaceae bacterium]|nr:C4-dicarboxylate ABC transporter substrate-binding protein [Synergistaceae bacterium]
LSDEDRAVISEACSKVTEMSIDLAEKDQIKSLELMKEEGVEVYSYTREELTPLFSRVASTWEKLGEKLTKELVEDLISRHAEK